MAKPAAPALLRQQEGRVFILRVANTPMNNTALPFKKAAPEFCERAISEMGHLKPLQPR